MQTLKSLMISLPLLMVPCQQLLLNPAQAQTVLGPSEAAAHLARAHAISGNCPHLPQAEHDELGDYVSMAEIVLVKQIGPEEAVSVIENAHDEGQAMTCSDDTSQLVFDALVAARAAMRLAETGQAAEEDTAVASVVPEEQDKAEEDISAVKTEASRQDSEQRTATVEKEKPSVDNSAALADYTRAAAAYYVERRCQHLARRDAVGFWKAIVAKHNAVLSKHDRKMVARAKSAAIARANALHGCGNNTRRMVTAGYSMVRSN